MNNSNKLFDKKPGQTKPTFPFGRNEANMVYPPWLWEQEQKRKPKIRIPDIIMKK